MADWLNNRKEIFAWIAVGCVLFMASLIATFPFSALQARLLSELNRTARIDTQITSWSIAWPVGIKWQDITFSKSDWTPIQIAFLQARIEPLQALRGDLGLDIVARLNEASSSTGLAKATLAVSSFSLEGPITIKGQLQHIDLSQILRRYISHGVLSGTFSHRIESGLQENSAIKGEGIWQAEAADLTIENIPLGQRRTLSLAFTTVSAGVSCQNEVCTVTELKGEGTDGSFTGEGTITVQQPILNSQLALTVTIIPGAGFASKASSLGLPPLPAGSPIKLKLIGPLAQARIAL